MDKKNAFKPDDLEKGYYEKNLNDPGEYPFTRGIHPEMYSNRLWTMRQFSGFGSAKHTNERLKYLLVHGETGLSIAFDMPTLLGRDSDDPLYGRETGMCGAAIDTLADMEALFDGIDLNPPLSTSMTINAPAMVIFAMYLAIAEKKGVDWKNLRGTIQNDILKEYIAQKEWIYPPEPSMRLITDIFSFCAKYVPKWYPISVSGYHIREAGATAVQELAFTLADGIEYVDAAVKTGLNVDDFAPRISFFFNSHIDFFEEIAKFRAARRMWAKIMKDRFGAKNSKSLQLRFHTQTSGVSLQAVEPKNNIVRTTLQALAAVLGGTQSLHTNSYDEAFCLPTEEAVKTALRTQQIIACESGISSVVDPLGGSYYLERLTDEVEKEAKKYIEEIDKMGGMVAAIKKGYPQREVRSSAYGQCKRIASGEKIIVSINKYQSSEQPNIPVLKINPEIQKQQGARLNEIKRNRDNSKVRECLDAARRAAGTAENLMVPILEAVKHYATLGEICEALKKEFGTYREEVK